MSVFDNDMIKFINSDWYACYVVKNKFDNKLCKHHDLYTYQHRSSASSFFNLLLRLVYAA